MPAYIAKPLYCFQHAPPPHPQHAPHQHKPIKYGAREQTAPINMSRPLSPATIKQIHQIVSTLLYYSCAVDPTMAVPLSSIVAWQTTGTEDVLSAYCQLLDYATTHQNATIQFLASDMILAVHSDASYPSKFGGKSRAGGYYFSTNNNHTLKNGTILTMSTITKHVVGSAAKVGLAALFLQLQTNCTPLSHTCQNGARPTKNCHKHQQLIGAWPHHQNHASQSH